MRHSSLIHNPTTTGREKTTFETRTAAPPAVPSDMGLAVLLMYTIDALSSAAESTLSGQNMYVEALWNADEKRSYITGSHHR